MKIGKSRSVEAKIYRLSCRTAENQYADLKNAVSRKVPRNLNYCYYVAFERIHRSKLVIRTSEVAEETYENNKSFEAFHTLSLVESIMESNPASKSYVFEKLFL